VLLFGENQASVVGSLDELLPLLFREDVEEFPIFIIKIKMFPCKVRDQVGFESDIAIDPHLLLTADEMLVVR
jgi:hypothetical protein